MENFSSIGRYIRLWTYRQPFIWPGISLLSLYAGEMLEIPFYILFSAGIVFFFFISRSWSSRAVTYFLILWCLTATLWLLQTRIDAEKSQLADMIPDKFFAKGKLIEYSGGRGIIEIASLNGKNLPNLSMKFSANKNKLPKSLEAGAIYTFEGKKLFWNYPMYPGDFDEKAFYNNKGIYLKARIKNIRLQEKVSFFEKARNGFNGFIRSRARKLLPGRRGEVAIAAMSGDKRSLDRGVKKEFALSGTMHLLAVSGFHVGLIFAFLVRLFSFFPFLGRLKYLISLLSLWIYITFIGAPASAVRAGIMLTAAGWGIYWGRGIFSWANFWLAFSLILLWDPDSLRDAGFVLSFSALAGILLFLPAIRGYTFSLRNKGRIFFAYAAGLIGLSFSAQMGTVIPASAWFGGQNLLAPFVNLAAVPIFSIFFILLIIFVIIGAIAPFSDFLFSFSGKPLLQILLKLTAVASEYAVSFNPWSFHPFGVVLIFLTVSVYLRFRSWMGRYLLYAALSVIPFLLLLVPLRYPVEVIQMNVGQGDAAVLKADGKLFLFDAGKKQRRFSLALNKLCASDTFKSVFISHTDYDHIGGLLGEMDAMPEYAFWPAKSEGKLADTLRNRLKNRRVNILPAQTGIVYSSDLARIYCLENGRFGKLLGWDKNNSSAVYLVETRNFRYLITGDAERKEERILALWGGFLKGAVFKAGHHGSAEATGNLFLKEMQPSLAVISCGRNNRYGHPAKEVLSRIKNNGCVIHRTDENGFWAKALIVDMFR